MQKLNYKFLNYTFSQHPIAVASKALGTRASTNCPRPSCSSEQLRIEQVWHVCGHHSKPLPPA